MAVTGHADEAQMRRDYSLVDSTMVNRVDGRVSKVRLG